MYFVHRYIVHRECYFQVNSKKRFVPVGSIFYAVFAMKSNSRIWRFKPRTSSLLTDVLSLKPVCQKTGVTEIRTVNYFFNQSQDNMQTALGIFPQYTKQRSQGSLFLADQRTKYVFQKRRSSQLQTIDLDISFVYVITIFLTFSL